MAIMHGGGSGEHELGACAKTLHGVMRACDTHLCLEIMAHLAIDEIGVSELTAILELDISHVSHNLASLRDAGIVSARRDKRRRIYGFSKAVVLRPVSDRVYVEITSPNAMSMAVIISRGLYERLRKKRLDTGCSLRPSLWAELVIVPGRLQASADIRAQAALTDASAFARDQSSIGGLSPTSVR